MPYKVCNIQFSYRREIYITYDFVIASSTISHVLERPATIDVLQDTGDPVISTFRMLCPVATAKARRRQAHRTLSSVLWPDVIDPLNSDHFP